MERSVAAERMWMRRIGWSDPDALVHDPFALQATDHVQELQL